MIINRLREKFLTAVSLVVLGLLLCPVSSDANLFIKRPVYLGLNDGLINHWTFDGPDIYGTTAINVASSVGNGSIVNTPNPMIGKLGQALSFNGSNESVTGTLGQSITGSYTMSAWFYWRELRGGDWQTIVASTDSPGNHGMWMLGNVIDYYYNGSHTSNTVFTLNQWYHVAITFDGSNGTLYVNGEVDPNFPVAMGANTIQHIGVSYSFFGKYLNGVVDDVRIYNRALSSDEIKRVYGLGAKSKVGVTNHNVLTDGLVGHWTFDGPDIYGTTAIDKSENGNHGTITNGPLRTIGKTGQALKFAGLTTYDVVTIPYASPELSFSGNDPITISAWIKPDNTQLDSGDARIIDQENEIVLRFNTTNDYVEFILNSFSTNDRISSGNNSISVGSWNYVVGKYDGSFIKIFINGVEVGSTSPTGTYGGNTNDFGINSSLQQQPFSGVIDDVRIYNRALSEDEIKVLYGKL